MSRMLSRARVLVSRCGSDESRELLGGQNRSELTYDAA
jgi:hypothetical protein